MLCQNQHLNLVQLLRDGVLELGIGAENCVEKSLRQIRKETNHKRYPCLSISNQSLKPFLKWNFEKIREFPKSRRHFGEGLKHFEIFWRFCSTHFTLYETTNKVFRQKVRKPDPKTIILQTWNKKVDHLVWILDICDSENYFKAGNWGYLRLISD